MVALFVIAGVLTALALWLLIAYNVLVRARNKVSEALSDIDVQLRLRHDLVPRLVQTVAAYARHEQALLHRTTQIREEAVRQDGGAIAELVENQLASALTSLTLVGERYPELHASSEFTKFANELTGIENEIQSASAIYNSNARIYNTMLQTLPMSLVGAMLHFTPATFVGLEVADAHESELAAA